MKLIAALYDVSAGLIAARRTMIVTTELSEFSENSDGKSLSPVVEFGTPNLPEQGMTSLSPADAERLKLAFQHCRDMEGTLNEQLGPMPWRGRRFFRPMAKRSIAWWRGSTRMVAEKTRRGRAVSRRQGFGRYRVDRRCRGCNKIKSFSKAASETCHGRDG
jgi:hypothetical protein